MQALIKKLCEQKNLSADEMGVALESILESQNEFEIARFLTLLSTKGETAEEIDGLVYAMQTTMRKLDTPHHTLDIVGTGGDGFNTVNISTAAALLAASCGVKIAKHGNRSASSLAGSADMLEEAGLNLDLSPAEILHCLHCHHFGFLYAPNFHPTLAKLTSLRKRMGIPTIFNLLGPLLNPCRPKFLMIGVSKKKFLPIFAEVLTRMNIHRALVFNCHGLDEICTLAPIDVLEVQHSKITASLIDPADYGFAYCNIEDLRGSTAAKNAQIIQSAWQGEKGAISDSMILNAGLANYLFGINKTIEEGINLAREIHSQGVAFEQWKQILQTSRTFKKNQKLSYE